MSEENIEQTNKTEEVKPTVESLEPVVESLEPVVESLESSEPVESLEEPAPVTEAAPITITEPEVINEVKEPASEAVKEPEPVINEPAEPEAASEPAPEKKEEVKEEVKETKPEAKKKDGKKPNMVLIIIIVVLILAIVGGVVFLVLNNKGSNSGGNEPSINKLGTAAKLKVSYRNYTFTIPNEYTAEISNNRLILTGEGTVYAIEIKDNSYETIVSNKDSIKSSYEQKNYSVNKIEEMNISSHKYLYLDVNNGTSVRVFFRQNDSTTVFVGAIAKEDGSEVTDNNLYAIEKILSTCTFGTDRVIIGESGEYSFDETFDIIDELILDEHALQNNPVNEEEVVPEEKVEEPVEENKTPEKETKEEEPVEEKTEEPVTATDENTDNNENNEDNNSEEVDTSGEEDTSGE